MPGWRERAPADLVDGTLAATRRVQKRVRRLPARVTVYFVLALSLFEADSCCGIWASPVAGPRTPACDPSESALRQARRRVGRASADAV
ncbi:transposase domain-containing protein [Kitasatospora sp. NPDC001159]